MRETVTMKMVDGRTYLATAKNKRSALLPRASGIYIWTVQLSRALEGMVSGEELVDRFSKPFKRLRSERRETGTAGLYKQVHVVDSPPLLTQASVNRAATLLAAGHNDFSWVATMATLFQRPLYVGKAIDFRTRIPLHFNYKSTFSEQVRDMSMSMGDLAVTLFTLDWAVDHTDALGGDDSRQNGENDEEDTQSPSAGDDSEFDPEEFVPPGRQDQDRLIRLTESLLIRQLQPIFNQQVE